MQFTHYYNEETGEWGRPNSVRNGEFDHGPPDEIKKALELAEAVRAFRVKQPARFITFPGNSIEWENVCACIQTFDATPPVPSEAERLEKKLCNAYFEGGCPSAWLKAIAEELAAIKGGK